MEINKKILSKIKFDADKKYTVVHPIIDFHNGKLWKGIQLPIKMRRGFSKVSYWVTSNSELINMSSKKAMHLHGVTMSTPFHGECNKWTLKSIETYLKGQTKCEPLHVFNAVRNILVEYLDYKNPIYYDVLSLWIIGTHLFPIFNVYPIIYFHGGYGCGKSRAMQVCSLLAHNGILSTNITASSIFRLISQYRPSLFIDEAEMVKSKSYSSVLNMLLSGYKKGGGSYRVQNFGNEQITHRYEVYCPKMLAAINEINNDALNDRVITIQCVKSTNQDIVNKDVEHNKLFQSVYDELNIFALKFTEHVLRQYKEIESPFKELNGRRWELWKGFIAIARVIFNSESYEKNLCEYALSNTKMIDEHSFESILENVLKSKVNILRYYRNREIFNAFVIHASTLKVSEQYSWVSQAHIGHYLKRRNYTSNRVNLGGRGIAYLIDPVKFTS